MGLKLLSFAILIFSCGFAEKTAALAAGPVALIILSLISRQNAGKTLSALRAPLILLIFMSPFIIFTPGQTLVLNPGGIGIYRESLILLLTIALRSLTIFAFMSILINGSKIYEISKSLKRIGIPGKLIIILLSTWRYINLYMSDLRQLMTSARLRGFSLTRGLAHTAVSADILLTLLIRSYEQSERVQAAMVTRGFTGDIPDDKEKSAPETIDLLMSAAALIMAVGIILLELLC